MKQITWNLPPTLELDIVLNVRQICAMKWKIQAWLFKFKHTNRNKHTTYIQMKNIKVKEKLPLVDHEAPPSKSPTVTNKA